MPAATGVAHGDTARHRPVVEWAVQSTNNPTGDPRGPTYGSEGWGFESLRARQVFEDVRKPGKMRGGLCLPLCAKPKPEPARDHLLLRDDPEETGG